jgi:hypothetical protein
MFNELFLSKIVPFVDNVGKYSRVGEIPDENMAWRMRCACWLTKATDTHSEYVKLIAFPIQQW